MTEYDPLDYDNLARSVVNALLTAAAAPLPPDRFEGAGVYAIYYRGPLDYAPDDELEERPLYVGKADPPGGRRGDENVAQRSTTPLYQRLNQHASSIRQASNLDIERAYCRYLVVVPVWISLAERFLISYFAPLWNTVLDGFGNHDPGRGRLGGARPRWDIVHPGRSWANGLDAHENREGIIAEILNR